MNPFSRAAVRNKTTQSKYVEYLRAQTDTNYKQSRLQNSDAFKRVVMQTWSHLDAYSQQRHATGFSIQFTLILLSTCLTRKKQLSPFILTRSVLVTAKFFSKHYCVIHDINEFEYPFVLNIPKPLKKRISYVQYAYAPFTMRLQN